MTDESTPTDEPQTPDEQPQAEAPEAPAVEAPAAEEPVAEEAPVEQAPAEEPVAEEAPAEEPVAAESEIVVEAVENDADGEVLEVEEIEEVEAAPRVKPAIPGADLEVDIVVEGEDPFSHDADEYDEDGQLIEAEDVVDDQPITAVIDLAADARYRATGKRKTAVARVILKPGTGQYIINGKSLDEYFPRPTLQRIIRQPLETVGYEERMDVIARMHGGGVSAQSGALRHGVSKALLEADPNLRGELKRRGFLTRDARAKERKKAGLKKARKRPQFSKR